MRSSRRIAGLCFLIFFLVISLADQLRYTFLPGIKGWSIIVQRLPLGDLPLLEAVAPAYASFIARINRFPEATRFYFAPSFADSGNTAFDWWYLYILSRYCAYPRKVFCLHPSLYGGDRQRYLKEFIGTKTHYSDLAWIRERSITQVILVRNNAVYLLPVDHEIVL